jgi:hypothetical protein
MEDRSHFPAGMSLVLIGILLSAFYFALQAIFQAGFFFGLSLFPHEAIIVGLFGSLLSIALFFAVLLRMRAAYGFLLAGIIVQGGNLLVSAEKLMSNSPYGSYVLFYYGCLSVCFLFMVVFFTYVMERRKHFLGGHAHHGDDRWFLWSIIFLSLAFAAVVGIGTISLQSDIRERENAIKEAVADMSLNDAMILCSLEKGYFQDICWGDAAITHYEEGTIDLCDRIAGSHERFKCIIFFALARQDPSICQSLDGAGQETICRAFVTMDPKECESLPQTDRNMCETLIMAR